MTQSLIFDPLVSAPVLQAALICAVIAILLSFYRQLSGKWLRLAAFTVLGVALLNPSVQRENRRSLSDIVIALIDESASQMIADRPAQTQAALDTLQTQIAGLSNTELRIVRFADGENNSGSRAIEALSAALTKEPAGRIAGVFMISDGQIHDADLALPLQAPLHLLLTGRNTDRDRRLVIKNAPAFAILGEEQSIVLRIEEQGDRPQSSDFLSVGISVDGAAVRQFDLPVGQDIALPFTLSKAGPNVVQFSLPADDSELTDQNNNAVVQINGIRDRLRVMLISGEPHNGERTWRNLLKSDSAIDLVHFTILRPPGKGDGAAIDELSLIAFPTQALFEDKIKDFDLIIFDRYRRWGILQDRYFQNIANYVTQGGALFVSVGAEYAGAESIYRSPMGAVIPAIPSARVLTKGFLPELTDLGQRHPVTATLSATQTPEWGRWFRHIDVTPAPGTDVLMTGADNKPLLILNETGAGRSAFMASDQSWLWARGFEGGGPQTEMLRRVAHWLMREPDLEAESLRAEATPQGIKITRRSLDPLTNPVTITAPDGSVTAVDLQSIGPGLFQDTLPVQQTGLYQLVHNDLSAVIAIGPAAPKEYENTIASHDPLIDKINSVTRIEDGLPDLRTVRKDRPVAGRGWLGITPQNAYDVTGITVKPAVPAWLLLALASMIMVGAWVRESRQT